MRRAIRRLVRPTTNGGAFAQRPQRVHVLHVPGGEVMCSASELGGVVVNGASRHARNGRNANAALLVNVEDRDLRGDDVLAGVKLQRRMETAAYRAAGESYKAPAQRVGDFMASAGKFNRSQSEHRSRLEVEPTHARGVEWVDLNQVLPPFVARSLHAAIPFVQWAYSWLQRPECRA